MEQLEARPYTKFTSRETSQLENDEALGKNLHSIDGAIYGHNTTVVDSLETLKQYADQKFAKKIRGGEAWIKILHPGTCLNG